MRIRGTVLCFLLCALAGQAAALADASSDMRRASSLVQRGDKAFQSGDLAKAQKLFGDAIEVIPSYPEAHMGLGHVAMKESRFEDAVAEYTAARDGYADVSGVMQEYRMEKYREAQREIRELEDQISVINDSNVKVSDATRRDKTLQFEQKIQSLRAMPYPEVGEPVEPPAELFFHLGNAQFRLARHEEALAAWEECVKLDSAFAAVYNNLAVLYMMKDRFDDARQAVARAEELGVTVNPNLKADLARRGGGQ